MSQIGLPDPEQDRGALAELEPDEIDAETVRDALSVYLITPSGATNPRTLHVPAHAGDPSAAAGDTLCRHLPTDSEQVFKSAGTYPAPHGEVCEACLDALRDDQAPPTPADPWPATMRVHQDGTAQLPHMAFDALGEQVWIWATADQQVIATPEPPASVERLSRGDHATGPAQAYHRTRTRNKLPLTLCRVAGLDAGDLIWWRRAGDRLIGGQP